MNQVILFQEKIERSPLQILPSALEEAELLEDRRNLEAFQRDLTVVFREYALATVLLFAAAAGTHYYVDKDNAELVAAGKKSESSFFSKKTLRNSFVGAGSVTLLIAGFTFGVSVINRRETKKNKELLTPIDI